MENIETKSAGHITFHGVWEFFEQRGEVYRAKRTDPLSDSINKARHGRWECSKAHFEHYRAVILAPLPVEG